ncbi:zf-HC2 domain-containing protein [Paenibacillus septentrionalis]|uniref:Anti-sigma-W factor RsiW n=1 Tax=Paenibacillus septentrionalis TaxID=429342 RepID=A0ABW1VCT5_9BACL
MNCKVAIEFIHQYLDGELENHQHEQLNTHLKQCESCMKTYEQLERTDALSRFALQSSMANERKPAEVSNLKQSILAQLPSTRSTQSKARFVRWLYRYPGLTAAAVFLAVMVISMFASWDQDAKLVISGSQEDLQYIVIEGNTVIVPEGIELTGDLVVENGIVEVKGAVSGDVTVIDGQMVLASTGHIAGQSKVIDQALDWFWYKVTSSFSDVIPQ